MNAHLSTAKLRTYLGMLFFTTLITFSSAGQQVAVPHSIGGNIWIPADRPDFISYKGNACPTIYDISGTNADNCLIHNAMQWITDNSPTGSGYFGLEFPAGKTRLSGNGYTASISTPITSVDASGLQHTARIPMRGASNGTTLLVADAGAESVLGLLTEDDCHGATGDCVITISDLTIAGQGRNSTGDGIENLNTTHVHTIRVGITGFNGKCINLQGSAERNAFEDGNSNGCQSAVNMSGDTNEELFSHWDATQNGQEDGTNYCYGSANCINGMLNISSQSSPVGWGVDPKAAVHLDGDRIEWHASTIKGTAVQGGLSTMASTTMIYETYFEGYPFSNQPRTNASVQIGGKLPISTSSSAIGTTDLIIPVTNAAVQWLYSQDPAHAADVCCHAGRNIFNIYPRDYLPSSTAASAYLAASGPVILRNSVETVSINTFSGDGAAHLATRAINGTTAFAWPSTSILEYKLQTGGYGVTRLISNHFNSIIPLNYSDHSGSNPSYYTDSCSDYTLLSSPIQGSTSSTCGEILVGFVPDGYSVQPPSASFYLPQEWNVELSNNSIYTGAGGELDGSGFVKVMADGAVSFSPGDDAPPPAPKRFDAGAISNGIYSNGSVNVAFGNWNGTFALGLLNDPGAGILGWKPGGTFMGSFYDPIFNSSLAVEYLGNKNQCTYTGATVANPGGTSRLCQFSGGVAQDVSSNGNTWVNEWADGGNGFATNTVLNVNAGIKINGTSGYTGTCTSPKSPVVTSGIVTGCQ